MKLLLNFQHTLNNFPIGEIDKTIKVTEQVLPIKNSIKCREDELLTKLVFLLSKFESLLLTLYHTMKFKNVTCGNVTRFTILCPVRGHVFPSGYL